MAPSQRTAILFLGVSLFLASTVSTLPTPESAPVNSKDPICVVGAGLSGLSTVLRLNEKGFSNIVVFEKSGVPGGKAKAWTDPNGKVFNLGAFAGVFASYNVTTGLLDKFGVPYSNAKLPILFYESQTGYTLNASTLPRNNTAIVDAYTRYTSLYNQSAEFFVPGFTNGVPDDLAVPFSEFLAKNKLDALVPGLWLSISAFGYGSLEEVPAIYALIWMPPSHVYATIVRPDLSSLTYVTDPNRLAREMAKFVKAKFIYNATIVDSRRSAKETVLTYRTNGTSDKQTQKCDRIVVAFPQLRAKMSALNLDKREDSVFAPVKTNQYFSTPLKLDNVTTAARYYEVLQLKPQSAPPITLAEPIGSGQPVFINPQYPKNVSDYYIAYSWKQGSEPITTDAVAGQVAAVGGRLNGASAALPEEKVSDVVVWEYFPHVDSQAIQAGWFERFEALQGHRRTYYTSSVRYFENMESVIVSAFELVDRYFCW